MELIERLDDGRRTFGQFEVVGTIGRGGFGEVFLGRSPDGGLVALKTIRADASDESPATLRQRFEREIEFLSAMTNPMVPEVVDRGPGRADWVAIRYVPGPSLARLVEERGPLKVEVVLWLAAELGEVIADISRIGVHRDIKPGNILITADGPQLIDFGIARRRLATALTRVELRVASLGYSPPERITAGVGGDDPSDDVFMLGASLFFAATGRAPLSGLVGVPDLAGLPPQLRPIVAPCLSVDPKARPKAAVVARWARERLTTASFRRALPTTIATDLNSARASVQRFGRTDPPVRLSSPMPPGPARRTEVTERFHSPPPRIAWEQKVGDWIRFVAVDKGRIVIATAGGDVRVLSESDGRELLHVELPAPPTAMVVPPGRDRAHITDSAGMLHTLDLAGHWLPRQRLGSVASACTAVGGVVVTATEDGIVQAVDGVSGQPRWQASLGAAVTGGIVHDGLAVYVGAADGRIHGFSVVDGGQVLEHDFGQRLLTAAVDQSGLHVAGADGGIWTVRRDGHRQLLVRPEESGPVPACTIDRGVLVAAGVRGTILAVDLAHRRTLWVRRDLCNLRCSLAVTRGLVLAGGAEGALFVLDTRNGATVLHQPGGGSSLDAPAVLSASGVVVAGWTDGTVAALPLAPTRVEVTT